MKPVRLSQPKLIVGIMNALEKQGVKSALPRQMNKVIEAANLIVEAFAVGMRDAPPGCGPAVWLASDKTGASSLFMAYTLAPTRFPFAKEAVPYDGADFGRCVGLLEACPDLRPRLGEMAEGLGPVWAMLAASWGGLEAFYHAAVAGDKGAAAHLRGGIDAIHKTAAGARK